MSAWPQRSHPPSPRTFARSPRNPSPWTILTACVGCPGGPFSRLRRDFTRWPGRPVVLLVGRVRFFLSRDYPFFFLAHIPNTISYVWRTQKRVGTSKYIKLYRVSESMQVDRRESMQVDSNFFCKITILRALGKIFTIDSGQKGGAGSHLYLSNEMTSYYNMPKT